MTDATRSPWGHIVTMLVLVGGFYALVLYPYELTELVKGAIIGFMGSAITWEFGAATAGATARQQDTASKQGAEAALTTPSVTVSAGPPATATVAPSDPLGGENG